MQAPLLVPESITAFLVLVQETLLPPAATIFLLVPVLSLPIIANAQFKTNPPFNNYGFTSPATEQKIGIGNFPSNASVQAKLHVSQFLLATNTATDGNLFRTDGNNAQTNAWRMFTGATAESSTQKGRIFVPANDSTFIIQATVSDLILADNKNKISVAEIIEMQKQIIALKGEVAQLKTKN